MATVAPGEIEAAGLGVLGRIAVGGAEHGKHHRATGDQLAAYHDISVRHTADALHRAVITEQLFDGMGEKAGLGAQPAQF